MWKCIEKYLPFTKSFAPLISGALFLPVVGARSIAQCLDTEYSWLAGPPDARSAALGSASSAFPGNSATALLNPGLLGLIEAKEFRIGYAPSYDISASKYFDCEGVRFISGSCTWHVPEWDGTFSGDVMYNGVDEQDTRPFLPIRLRYHGVAVSASHGMRLSRAFSAGAAIRYLSASVKALSPEWGDSYPIPIRSLCGDLGVVFTPATLTIPFTDSDMGGNVSFGAAIRNVGSTVHWIDEAQSNPIPSELRLGMAIRIRDTPPNRLPWTCDAAKLLISRTSQPSGIEKTDPFFTALLKTWYRNTDGSGKTLGQLLQEFALGTGVEYEYSRMVALRAGYFFAQPCYADAYRHPSFGLGLRLDPVMIDASYSHFRTEELTPFAPPFRVSVGIGFDAPAEAENPVETSGGGDITGR